jgi:outer membrane protein assembly factor BamE (lipoprotein component of BamABCDE complex)
MIPRTMFAPLVCLALALSSCIAVPIPTSETKVLTGTPVTDEQLAFLTVNVTTMQQVVEALGSPNVIWEDARVFAYNWEMRQGILLWAAGAYVTGGAGAKDIQKHYMLLIQFDPQGRVQRFERTHRPLTQSYPNFLRRWARYPEKAAADKKAIVLLRIECTIDGQSHEPFVTPSFTVEPIFAFGIGSFANAGEPNFVGSKFLSDESRHDGWTYFTLSPGVYYLAVLGPDSGVVSYAGALDSKEYVRRAPRWRIDVPDDARLIYAGSLQFAGKIDDKLAFGATIINPTGDEPVLSDQHELASSLLAEHFPDASDTKTILLRRWHAGDPIIIGSSHLVPGTN